MRLGKSLGADDGNTLGTSLGKELGAMLSVIDGARLGESLGSDDGNTTNMSLVGRTEICESLGITLGKSVGAERGSKFLLVLAPKSVPGVLVWIAEPVQLVGAPLGADDDIRLGRSLGIELGLSLGSADGPKLGKSIGAKLGKSDRSRLGTSLALSKATLLETL